MRDALRKIQAEITAVKGEDSNPVRVIGSMLMDHIRSYPEDAQRVLVENKTVLGSWEYMQAEASKQLKGTFSPDEGFRIVLQYYGAAVPETVSEPKATAKPIIKTSLDDLF